MKSSRAAWVGLAIAVVAAGLFALRLSLHGNPFVATSAGPHSVTLHWSPDPVATSYNVFRGTESGGPYVKIGSTPTPSYVDRPVPSGVTFYYVVTSFGNHTESGFSDEIKVVVP